jgi:DNA-binding transcriptional ArsR family regulator
LAEPRRQAIVRLVWSHELPAAAIAAAFPDVSRPAVSQHVAVLKEAGLLTERRDGTRRLYRADHRTMAELRTFLDEFWTTSLDRLRDLAEAAEAAAEEQDRAHPDPNPKPNRTNRRTTSDG